MKYLLLICDEDPGCGVMDHGQGGTPLPAGVPMPQAEANSAERHGILVTGNPTHPAVAATVQFRGGDVLVTDGPFASVHGRIRGFDVIDGKQLEEVIELASRVPAQRTAPQAQAQPGPE